MDRSYEIHPQPADLGADCSLKVIESGQEAGGGFFPIEGDSASDGIAWWNGLTKENAATC
jgi:hypothetical protein